MAALFVGFTIYHFNRSTELVRFVFSTNSDSWAALLVNQTIGLWFIIKYHLEPTNVVADALSRLSPPSFSSLSMPYFHIIDQLKEENSTDSELVALHDKLRDNPGSMPEYSICDVCFTKVHSWFSLVLLPCILKYYGSSMIQQWRAILVWHALYIVWRLVFISLQCVRMCKLTSVIVMCVNSWNHPTWAR